MASRAAKDRWKTYYRILDNPLLALFPCDDCKRFRKSCVFIADCSLTPCADFDRAEDELVAEIDTDKHKIDQLLSELIAAKARLERNEKMLEAASKRTQKKLTSLLHASPLNGSHCPTAEDAVLEEFVSREL
ncbi:hypothetical protein LTR22_016408 [Elasticomyces elasticus]|nr:hypothetical protein LTR22_016408 [Elasticomyces elasticus]KAK4917294.1 hypothetical protein LTR49_014778 [Elasticomyces elasticus]KAK5764889.1 hypothetical protein LTS12_004916 [Elasticomyces elasticus]